MVYGHNDTSGDGCTIGMDRGWNTYARERFARGLLRLTVHDTMKFLLNILYTSTKEEYCGNYYLY